MSEWTRKDIWNRQHKAFSVQVSRHQVEAIQEGGCYDQEGLHRWAVYAFVYPSHPLFERFDTNKGMWDQPNLPGHSYVSFFKTHRNDSGATTSYQVGWDYNHDGDWRFTELASEAEAYEVFRDAEELFQYLANRVTEAEPA
jgi:hypothetical protein